MEHIKALCVVFEEISRHRHAMPAPFQTFFFFDLRDAGCDAVFLHTSNPNGTPFPVRDERVVWGEALVAPFLSTQLGGHMDLREGRLGDDSIFVYAHSVGEPLE